MYLIRAANTNASPLPSLPSHPILIHGLHFQTRGSNVISLASLPTCVCSNEHKTTHCPVNSQNWQGAKLRWSILHGVKYLIWRGCDYPSLTFLSDCKKKSLCLLYRNYVIQKLTLVIQNKIIIGHCTCDKKHCNLR